MYTASLPWRESASEAFLATIEAQPARTRWPQLLQEALQHRAHQRSAALTGGAEDGSGARAPPAAPPAVVVAGIVLSLPRPSCHGCGEAEAIARATPPRRYLCVSLGSGTRCVGLPPDTHEGDRALPACAEPFTVGDGHAEVLARRGLCAALQSWLAAPHTGDGSDENPFLSTDGAAEVGLPRGRTLRPGVEAVLVSTHWPCGALACAALGETGGHLLLRNAAGTSLRGWRSPPDGQGVTVVRGHWLAAHRSPVDVNPAFADAARVKPGKGLSNLHMSCSDKVWRWTVRGLLPRPLASALAAPLPLVEVVVAAAPGEAADSAAERQTAAVVDVFRRRSSLLRSRASGGRIPVVSVLPVAGGAPPATAAALTGDGGLSRCAWVTALGDGTAAASACVGSGRKRPRAVCVDGADDTGDSVGGCLLASFDQHVLSMKVGLPQGFTVAALGRQLEELRCLQDPATRAERASALARKLPLSRAWMRERVASLVGFSEGEGGDSDAVPMAAWLFEAQRGREEGGLPGGSTHVQEVDLLWTCKR